MRLTRTALVLSLYASLVAVTQGVQAAEDGQAVAIQTVLTAVRDALIGVQKRVPRENYPPLTAVTLTLQTEVIKEGGGQIRLLVVTLGGKAEKEDTQEIVIQLTPPSPYSPRNAAAESVTSGLENAIMSAVDGAQSAGSQELPLAFTGLQVTISFIVKSSGGGGGKIEILPISADLSGEVSKRSIQRIKVVFGALK